MFVSKERVPVSVDGGTNTIYIRAKMDYGTRQRVQSAIVHVTRGMDADALAAAPLDLGAANIALLTCNIVAWLGPAFRDEHGQPVPCTPDTIEALDPDEPLVDAVLAEINRRNAPAKDAEKNGSSSTNAGAPSLPVNGSTAPSVNGIPTLPLPTPGAGRRRS